MERVEEGEAQESAMRTALQEAAMQFMKKALPKGFCLVTSNSDESILTVSFVADCFQAKNMRNGQWKSDWTIRVEGKEATLEGKISTLVHYFEDGNVQLDASKSTQAQISFNLEDEPSDKAKAIIAAIKKAEDEVQLALNESYAQVAENTFRKLRRQLPMTRSKVDW